MSWLSWLTWRTAGLVALVLAAIVVLAWVGGRFGAEWPAAVQIVTTIALVIVTYGLVQATGRLVKAQEHPQSALRLEARERAVRELAKVLARQSWLFNSVREGFVDMASRENYEGIMAQSFEEDSKHLQALAGELEAVAIDLPGQLAVDALRLATLAWRAATYINSIRAEALQERFDAQQDERAFNSDVVRDRWILEVRPTLPDKPEWDDAISGRPLYDAARLAPDLAEDAKKYLRSDDPEYRDPRDLV